MYGAFELLGSHCRLLPERLGFAADYAVARVLRLSLLLSAIENTFLVAYRHRGHSKLALGTGFLWKSLVL